MNKKRLSITSIIMMMTVFVFALTLVNMTGCSKKEKTDVQLISKHGEPGSHNHGHVCMRCHNPNEEGKGNFTLAGSLYSYNQRDPLPNGIIRIYSEDRQQGELLLELEADINGNFYTTEAIDFTREMFVVAVSPDGNTNEMNTPLTEGACNTCHNHAPGRIWVN